MTDAVRKIIEKGIHVLDHRTATTQGVADAILSALNAAGYKVEEDWRPTSEAPESWWAEGKFVVAWWSGSKIAQTIYWGTIEFEDLDGFTQTYAGWLDSEGEKVSTPCAIRPLPAPPVTKGEGQ